MSSLFHSTPERQRFLSADDAVPAAAHARQMLRLLLAQDGSTTRLCETIAGGPIALHVAVQQVVHTVPSSVHEVLPGTRFIERLTSLVAHGEVMMDNLSYIALEGLSPPLQRDLEAGTQPIGHLLASLWVRRAFLAAVPAIYARLWGTVGLPDAEASRVYRIATPEGPRMLIAETYRRGMRMSRNGVPGA